MKIKNFVWKSEHYIITYDFMRLQKSIEFDEQSTAHVNNKRFAVDAFNKWFNIGLYNLSLIYFILVMIRT